MINFTVISLVLPVYANTLCELINDVSENEKQLCTKTDCFFPDKSLANKDVVIDSSVNWNSNKNLVLHTKGNIIFKKQGRITSKNNGSIILKSGMEPGNKETYDATVKFEGDSTQIEILGIGEIKVYYNPQKGDKKYKYHNPNSYRRNIAPESRVISYMLVNNIDELQDISKFLSGNYALSQSIDAVETQLWADGKGFMPMGGERQKGKPFSGNFDGNYYTIERLHINRPEEDEVGIFALTSGRMMANNIISNLHIKHAKIIGNFHVGAIVGEGASTNLVNINIENSFISGYGSKSTVDNNVPLRSVGYVIGALQYGFLSNLNKDKETQVYVDGVSITDSNPCGAYFNPCIYEKDCKTKEK